MGGTKDGERFDKCSYFDECKKHVELRYSSNSDEKEDDGDMAAVEALEAELRACLR